MTEQTETTDLDPATLEAAADVVRQMSVDPMYYGHQRNVLRVALKKVLALMPDAKA